MMSLIIANLKLFGEFLCERIVEMAGIWSRNGTKIDKVAPGERVHVERSVVLSGYAPWIVCAKM